MFSIPVLTPQVFRLEEGKRSRKALEMEKREGFNAKSVEGRERDRLLMIKPGVET